METYWWERGRQPFPLVDGPKDYAGQDLHSVYLATSDALSHAFLNGVSVENCVFMDVKLDYCELAESTFTDTRFVKVNLSASDFVRSNISNCIFEACSFSNGEWRQSKFENIKFIGCDFTHTTINLCSFQDCQFTNELTGSLDSRSISYNTFAGCSFEIPISDHLVISRNFGLPAKAEISPLVQTHHRRTLEELCIFSSAGRVLAHDLVEALRDESDKPQGRLKKLRLEFISNIINLVAHEGRLSASSLIYIEEIFVELTKRATSEVDFMAVMTAVINVRNALYDAAIRATERDNSQDTTCAGIIFRFKETYAQSDVRTFIDALSEVIFGRPGDIEVISIHTGSTLIECAFPILASAASVIGAVNLILGQANTSIKRVTEISDGIRRFVQKRKPRSLLRAQKKRPRRVVGRVPAIMNPAASIPELSYVRAAARRSGEVLIKFDDQVEIKIILLEKRRKAG